MHLATYAMSDAPKMLAHYDRSIGPRDHIDPEGQVYNLAPAYAHGARGRFDRLCDGLEIGAKTRPLADLVVTKPKGRDDFDTREFMKAAYEELKALVGEDRIVSAYVHLDEPGAEPHMHFAFVPVVETPVMTNDKTQPLRWTKADEHKNREHKAGEIKRDSKGTPRYKRVPKLDAEGNPIVRRTAAASKMFTKKDMRELHPRMEAALCARLEVDRVGLVLGDDDARKTLSELSHDEYERATRELSRVQGEVEDKTGRLEDLQGRVQGLEDQKSRLNEQISRLEQVVRKAEEAVRQLVSAIRRKAAAIPAALGGGARDAGERFGTFARYHAPRPVEYRKQIRDMHAPAPGPQGIKQVMKAANDAADLQRSAGGRSIEEWQR